MALSKEQFIQQLRQQYPSEFKGMDDWYVYTAGMRANPGANVEEWSQAYEMQDRVMHDPQSFREPPDDLNWFEDMFDYGIDENSYDWMKSAYVNSLTGKTEELLKGKPRYDLQAYNPNILEDIGSMFLSLWMPLDAISLFAPGITGVSGAASRMGLKRLGLKADTIVGTSVARSIESGIGLGIYEGAMGGVVAGINGDNVVKGIAEGVVHGGVMGGLIGAIGGGMGAKNAEILSQSAKLQKSISELGQNWVYKMTGTPAQIGAEATVFSVPDIANKLTYGVLDTDPESPTYGQMRDMHAKDVLRSVMTNVGFVSALKAQNHLLKNYLLDTDPSKQTKTDVEKSSEAATKRAKDKVNENKDIKNEQKEAFNEQFKNISQDQFEAKQVQIGKFRDLVQFVFDNMKVITEPTIDLIVKQRQSLNGVLSYYKKKLEANPNDKTLEILVKEIEFELDKGNVAFNKAVEQLKEQAEINKRKGKQTIESKDEPIPEDAPEKIHYHDKETPVGEKNKGYENLTPDEFKEGKIIDEGKVQSGEYSQETQDRIYKKVISEETGKVTEEGLGVTYDKTYNKSAGKNESQGLFNLSKSYILDHIASLIERPTTTGKTPGEYIKSSTVSTLAAQWTKFAHWLAKKRPGKKQKSFEDVTAKDIRDYLRENPTHSEHMFSLVKKIRNKIGRENVDTSLLDVTAEQIKGFGSVGKGRKKKKKLGLGEKHEVSKNIELESKTGGYKRIVGEEDVSFSWSGKIISGAKSLKQKLISLPKKWWVKAALKAKDITNPFLRKYNIGKRTLVKVWTDKDTNNIVSHFVGKKGNRSTRILRKSLTSWLNEQGYTKDSFEYKSVQYWFQGKITARGSKTERPYTAEGKKIAYKLRDSWLAEIKKHAEGKGTNKAKGEKHFSPHELGEALKRIEELRKEGKETIEINKREYDLDMVETFLNFALENPLRIAEYVPSEASQKLYVVGTEVDITGLKPKTKPIKKVTKKDKKIREPKTEIKISKKTKSIEKNIESIDKKVKGLDAELEKAKKDLTGKDLYNKSLELEAKGKELATERMKLEKELADSLATDAVKSKIGETKKLTEAEFKKAKEEFFAGGKEFETQLEWVKKTRPELIVSLEKVTNLSKKKSEYIVGSLVDGVIRLAKKSLTSDTLPHEVAHNAVNILKSIGTEKTKQLIRDGIKIFKTEEALVEALGKYARGRITGKNKPKLSSWVKRFWSRVKLYFNIHNEKDVMRILGTEVLTGQITGGVKTLGVVTRQRANVLKSQTKLEENRNNINSSRAEQIFRELNGIEKVNGTEADFVRYLSFLNSPESKEAVSRRKQVALFELKEELETRKTPQGTLDLMYKAFNIKDIRRADTITINLMREYVKKVYEKLEPTMTEEVLTRNLDKASNKKLHWLMKYTKPLAEWVGDAIGGKLGETFQQKFFNFDVIKDTIYRGSSNKYVASIKKSLGRKYKDSIKWLVDEQAFKDADASNILTNRDYTARELRDSGLKKLGLKNPQELSRLLDDSGQRIYTEFKLAELREKGIITAEEYKILNAVGEHVELMDALYDMQINEIMRHVGSSVQRAEVQRVLSREFVQDYFYRKVTSEGLEHLKELGKESNIVKKIVDENLTSYVDDLARSQKMKTASQLKLLRQRKVITQKQYAKQLNDYRALETRVKNDKKIMSDLRQSVFDLLTQGRTKVNNKLRMKRGPKLDEVYEVLVDGKKKQIRMYHHEFDKTIPGYIETMSSYLATLRLFPEITSVSKEFNFKGKGYIPDLMKILEKNEDVGRFLKDGIEALTGIESQTTTAYREVERGLSQLTNFNVAAGLSAPTSGIKNLMIAVPQIIGQFGLKPTLHGLRTLFSAGSRQEALEKGTYQFATRGLGLGERKLALLEKLPGVGKYMTMETLFKFNLMETTEAWSRQASMFAGRMFFSSALPVLRGEVKKSFGRMSNKNIERMMKEVYKLSSDEISFLKNYNRGVNIAEMSKADRSMLQFIMDKVDHYSHVTTQGGTSAAMLPLWMNKYAAARALTTFQRIAYSVSWNTYQNYIKPMKTHKNIMPFVSMTIAQGLSGKALYELYSSLFGVEMPISFNNDLQKAKYYLWKGEALGLFSDLINPYGVGGGLNIPIMEPVIFRNFRLAKENADAWVNQSKTGAQALKDFTTGSVVLANMISRRNKKQRSELYELHQRTRTLVKAYLSEKGYNMPVGPSLSTRAPYYRDLKEAFHFGTNKEIKQAYSSAYNALFTEVGRGKDAIINFHKRDKYVKQTIKQVIEGLKPIYLSDDPAGRRMSRQKAFLTSLPSDKRAMVGKAMSKYEYRRRVYESIINDRSFSQKTFVSAGILF